MYFFFTFQPIGMYILYYFPVEHVDLKKSMYKMEGMTSENRIANLFIVTDQIRLVTASNQPIFIFSNNL